MMPKVGEMPVLKKVSQFRFTKEVGVRFKSWEVQERGPEAFRTLSSRILFSICSSKVKLFQYTAT
jgi:hypothetical protein